MFDDPERYEHDGFYEEDTDYEGEYETDYSDYIVDDEENENVLWDDEEEAADDLPEKKRRKRKNQVVLADNDTDTEETELSEQAMWQIAKEEQLIEELEADAEEHPFEDGTDEEEPERKKLKRELRAEALARLEDSARTQRDFENVIAWWDRLDANRERRERYHELSRSGDDVPLDYGASANELSKADVEYSGDSRYIDMPSCSSTMQSFSLRMNFVYRRTRASLAKCTIWGCLAKAKVPSPALAM